MVKKDNLVMASLGGRKIPNVFEKQTIRILYYSVLKDTKDRSPQREDLNPGLIQQPVFYTSTIDSRRGNHNLISLLMSSNSVLKNNCIVYKFASCLFGLVSFN